MIVQDLLTKQAFLSEEEQAAIEEQERKDAKRKAIMATLAGVAGVGAAGFGGKWLYDKYNKPRNPAELLDNPNQLLDVANGRLDGKLPAGVNKETAVKALSSLTNPGPNHGIGGAPAPKVVDTPLPSIETPAQLDTPSFFKNDVPAVTPGFSDALTALQSKLHQDETAHITTNGPKFEQAPGFVRRTAGNVVNNLRGVKSGVEEGLSNGVSEVNDAADTVGEYYKGVGNKVGEAAVGVRDGARNAWRKFW